MLSIPVQSLHARLLLLTISVQSPRLVTRRVCPECFFIFFYHSLHSFLWECLGNKIIKWSIRSATSKKPRRVILEQCGDIYSNRPAAEHFLRRALTLEPNLLPTPMVTQRRKNSAVYPNCRHDITCVSARNFPDSTDSMFFFFCSVCNLICNGVYIPFRAERGMTAWNCSMEFLCSHRPSDIT